MKDSVIAMLKKMVEYADKRCNGDCLGFDSDYVKGMIEDFENEGK